MSYNRNSGQQYKDVVEGLNRFILDHYRGLNREGRGDVVQMLDKAYDLLEEAQDEMLKDAFI